MFSDAAQFRAQFENAYTCVNDPQNLIKAFGDDERVAWLVEGVGRCLWHLQNLMVDSSGQPTSRTMEDEAHQHFRITHAGGLAHASGGSGAQTAAGYEVG